MPIRGPHIEVEATQEVRDALKGMLDIRLHPDEIMMTSHEREWIRIDYEEAEDLRLVYEEILDKFAPDDMRDVADFSLNWAGKRWRVHCSANTDGWSVKLRHIPQVDFPLERLGFDYEQVMSLVRNPGLALFCGPTNSGKSTTAAAVLNELFAEGLLGHAVTIEEPVEFIYPENPYIRQREIGQHVHSFSQGVHDAMRETPETIFLAEIREGAAADAAVHAALSGHRVIASLHTESVKESITRMWGLMSYNNRVLLPMALQGCMAQHLVTRPDRRPFALYETLQFNIEAKNVVSESAHSGTNHLEMLNHVFQKQGRDTLADHADRLVNTGKIDENLVSRWRSIV